MSNLKTLHTSLRIFDVTAEGAQVVGTTNPASDLQKTTENMQAHPAQKSSDVGSKRTDTFDAKREEFRRLIEGEYKDVYTREFQSHFNRRHREVLENAEKLSAQKPIIDALCARYGVEDGDTSSLLAAMERDKSSLEAQRIQQEEEENQSKLASRRYREERVTSQLEGWQAEIEQLAQSYPDFDLAQLAEDKRIIAMLRSGIPLSEAYEATHLSSIKEKIARTAAEKAVAQTVEGIRARGMRHRENGISSQNGIALKTDMSKLTREERQLLALRAANGEEILF